MAIVYENVTEDTLVHAIESATNTGEKAQAVENAILFLLGVEPNEDESFTDARARKVKEIREKQTKREEELAESLKNPQRVKAEVKESAEGVTVSPPKSNQPVNR